MRLLKIFLLIAISYDGAVSLVGLFLNTKKHGNQIIFPNFPSFRLFEYIQQGLTTRLHQVTIKNYQQCIKSIFAQISLKHRRGKNFSRSSRRSFCRTSLALSSQNTCLRTSGPKDQSRHNLSCQT